MSPFLLRSENISRARLDREGAYLAKHPSDAFLKIFIPPAREGKQIGIARQHVYLDRVKSMWAFNSVLESLEVGLAFWR